MNKIPIKTFFHLELSKRKESQTDQMVAYIGFLCICTLRVCGFDFFYNNINHRLL